VILGTGMVGNFLNTTAKPSTFLSRDGGLTWDKIFDEPATYDLGDFGSLIVLARNQVPTNEVFFSWDGGETWNVVTLPETVTINELFSLDAKTEQFFIVGRRPGDVGNRFYFGIDFSALHARDCVPADYERWIPHNGVKGPTCVLGHNIEYQRRKRDAQCFTPDGMNKVVGITPCKCQESDYECDADFDRSESSGKCLYTGNDLESSSIRLQCVDGAERYYLPNGYRKVPGDKCETELPIASRVERNCPGRRRPPRGSPVLRIVIAAVSALVLVALGLITGLYFGAKDERVRRMFPCIEFIGARYSSMATDDDNLGNANVQSEDTPEVSLSSDSN